jgi:lipopolysaccharide transport system permease protein
MQTTQSDRESLRTRWRLLTIFRELIQSRGLVQMLVVRDLKSRYRGSVLGLVWTLLNPLLYMCIYVLVFSVYMRMAMERYAAFFLCGFLPWIWFSSSLMAGTTSILEGGGLLKKVFFPPQVLPTVAVIANFVNFLLSLPLLVGVLLLYGVTLGWALLALPLVMALQFAFTLGLTLIVSSISVRYRDIPPILTHLLTFWFFLTPIIYPITQAPEQFRALLYLNPMTPFCIAYQNALLYNELPSGEILGAMTGAGIVALVAGVVVFSRFRWSFAEEV